MQNNSAMKNAGGFSSPRRKTNKMGGGARIKVAVRVRPMLGHE